MVLSRVTEGCTPPRRHRFTSYTTGVVCRAAGINEEGQDLVPHVVHQRPMQTSSREAGAFNNIRLLQSDVKDLPTQNQIPAQEDNTRATTLCDSIFYKWVPPTSMKLSASLSSHRLWQLEHCQAQGLCSGQLLQLCQDHSTFSGQHQGLCCSIPARLHSSKKRVA